MDGLQKIEYGSLASSSVINDNFEYLGNRIKSIADTQASTKSYVSSVLTIYQDINALEYSETVALEPNTINKIKPIGDLTFNLPTIDNETKFYQIYLLLDLNKYTLFAWNYNNGETDYTIYTNVPTIESDTTLFNSDGTTYTGSDFTIEENDGEYVIKYGENETAYSADKNAEVDFDTDNFIFYDVDLGADWSFNEASLDITTPGSYNVIYEYDGTNWVCGIIQRSEVS